MENSNSGNSGKIIGALLVGAAIGVTLGLLFAPEKGSVTRRRLFRGMRDLRDDLKERMSGTNVKEEDDETDDLENTGEADESPDEYKSNPGNKTGRNHKSAKSRVD